MFTNILSNDCFNCWAPCTNKTVARRHVGAGVSSLYNDTYNEWRETWVASSWQWWSLWTLTPPSQSTDQWQAGSLASLANHTLTNVMCLWKLLDVVTLPLSWHCTTVHMCTQHMSHHWAQCLGDPGPWDHHDHDDNRARASWDPKSLVLCCDDGGNPKCTGLLWQGARDVNSGVQYWQSCEDLCWPVSAVSWPPVASSGHQCSVGTWTQSSKLCHNSVSSSVAHSSEKTTCYGSDNVTWYSVKIQSD